ncbi:MULTISPECIES: YSIRK-type signal peptide-containing protein [Elizabethkingia]
MTVSRNYYSIKKHTFGVTSNHNL